MDQLFSKFKNHLGDDYFDRLNGTFQENQINQLFEDIHFPKLIHEKLVLVQLLKEQNFIKRGDSTCSSETLNASTTSASSTSHDCSISHKRKRVIESVVLDELPECKANELELSIIDTVRTKEDQIQLKLDHTQNELNEANKRLISTIGECNELRAKAQFWNGSILRQITHGVGCAARALLEQMLLAQYFSHHSGQFTRNRCIRYASSIKLQSHTNFSKLEGLRHLIDCPTFNHELKSPTLFIPHTNEHSTCTEVQQAVEELYQVLSRSFSHATVEGDTIYIAESHKEFKPKHRLALFSLLKMFNFDVRFIEAIQVYKRIDEVSMS